MPVDDLRLQLELRLRGELLRDWCRQLAAADEQVEFDDGWCSGQRVIRFCTKIADALVGGWRETGDCWGLGRLALYEVEDSSDGVRLALRVSLKGMPAETRARIQELIDEGAGLSPDGCIATLRSWELAKGGCTANDAVDLLDAAWRTLVVPYERELVDELIEGDVKDEGDADAGAGVPESPSTPEDEQDDVLLTEGAERAVVSDRFERSKKARALCIAAHGTVCMVCGMDFGEMYGPEFAGTIDVHHRVPLSEIRKDYVVDPVRDLVPVCPNCHRALHSKPGGGVYTVEELRSLLRGH